MAITQKSLNEQLRSQFMAFVKTALVGGEFEVLQTNSNEFAIPCLDSEGFEKYLTIKFSVPTGSRDGDLYDGYAVAEEYALKCKEKAEKAEKAKAEKAKKIERDKKLREHKHSASATE